VIPWGKSRSGSLAPSALVKERSTSEPAGLERLCFNATSLTRRACAHFDAVTDAVVYVKPQTSWVTTPADKSIRNRRIKTMEQKEKLTYDGAPRIRPWSYARALLTNLETRTAASQLI